MDGMCKYRYSVGICAMQIMSVVFYAHSSPQSNIRKKKNGGKGEKGKKKKKGKRKKKLKPYISKRLNIQVHKHSINGNI